MNSRKRREMEERQLEGQRNLKAERNAQDQRTQRAILEMTQRREKLDRRSALVEKLQRNAVELYREAIEMQLSAEELWAEVCASGSSTELSKRRAELRVKLMDQFHLADQALADRRQDVEALEQHVAQEQRELAQQREEVRQWMARRHQELGEEATKLIQRERELDRKEADLAMLEAQWHDQRLGYEQEIRRLRHLVRS